MKKLLIINRAQFGYHIDSYKYCQYLKDKFKITYLCLDVGREKIEEDGVNVIYIPYSNSFIKKGLSLIKASREKIKHEHYDIIFIVYFLMSSWIKLGFKKSKFVLDIRTGSVSIQNLKRFIEDNILRVESLFFENITIISECLRKKLNFNINKSHILPLGSDPISSTLKEFNTINLLYVGTLNGREIEKTVLGLASFLNLKENKSLLNKIRYDIIGFGTKENESLLKQTIIKNNLKNIVKFHGQIKHNDLKPYFDKANIGISYIPITEYYQCQPPTKTFEYINSGLFCIATSTSIHQELITEDNGILCLDDSQSFSKSLQKLFEIKKNINSKKISKSLKQYSWEVIIKENLKNYLENLK